MSKTSNVDKMFDDLDVKDYVVEPIPREIDARGYMYIVMDSAFPDFIKIGKTTDMYKRLLGYNSNRPVKTVSLFMISEMFEDVSLVEKKILAHLYKVADPTTFRLEWFEVGHKDLMIKLINAAEEQFPLVQ